MTSTEQRLLVRRYSVHVCPRVGKTGKSALLGFYIEVRQSGCRQSSQLQSCTRAPERGGRQELDELCFTVTCLQCVCWFL